MVHSRRDICFDLLKSAIWLIQTDEVTHVDVTLIISKRWCVYNLLHWDAILSKDRNKQIHINALSLVSPIYRWTYASYCMETCRNEMHCICYQFWRRALQQMSWFYYPISFKWHQNVETKREYCVYTSSFRP